MPLVIKHQRILAKELQYPIFIGTDLKDPDLWAPFLGRQLCLVTDDQVAAFHLSAWRQFFEGLNIPQIDVISFRPGETSKSIESAEILWNSLIQKQHKRDTLLVALGGGVIGDLVGFVAATYLRGVSYIQLPTSLMAQVDASLGGKCGVNHAMGKNLIGAFYQPKAIFLDSHFLNTLPQRYYLEGLAEVVKYGVALSAPFFEWIEANLVGILDRDPFLLSHLLQTASDIKMKVIEEDEKDHSLRLFLNFGHTLGHALESATGYQRYRHGEAVAIGLQAATWLSVQRGFVGESVLSRVYAVLKALGFSLGLPADLTFERVSLYWAHDKKNRSAGLTWVLLSDLGKSQLVSDLRLEEMRAMINYLHAINEEVK